MIARYISVVAHPYPVCRFKFVRDNDRKPLFIYKRQFNAEPLRNKQSQSENHQNKYDDFEQFYHNIE